MAHPGSPEGLSPPAAMQPLPVTPVRLRTSPPEASPTLSVDLRESQGWALGGGTPGSQKPFPTGPSVGGGGVGGAGEASRTSLFVCKLVGLEAADLASALFTTACWTLLCWSLGYHALTSLPSGAGGSWQGLIHERARRVGTVHLPC